MGGFLHLKPTAGCEISILILVFFMEGGGGLYKYPNEKYIKAPCIKKKQISKLIFDTLLRA
jgi:hypothetical protein